jgi:hypothetical protein
MWFLPPFAHACLFSCKQFIEQQMVQFQNSILKCLHHHTLFIVFFDKTFEAHRVWILSCSGLGVNVWFTTQLVFPTFWLFFTILSTTFCMRFGLPHPLITCILRCVCTHPIDPMGIHLLCYVHDNECIGTHDAIHDTFAAIGRNVGFHVWPKQLYALLSTTFNSFHQWIDIVLTKEGIHTLTDVVIVDPTQVDLLPWSCTIQRFTASDKIQAKENSYHNQHPINQFLPVTI